MYTSKEMMNRIYENSIRMGITLNKKHKKLFGNYGIRFGTQEIARYGWPREAMALVADIIYEISREKVNITRVSELLNNLPEKKVQYTFDKTIIARFKRFLGD